MDSCTLALEAGGGGANILNWLLLDTFLKIGMAAGRGLDLEFCASQLCSKSANSAWRSSRVATEGQRDTFFTTDRRLKIYWTEIDAMSFNYYLSFEL